MIIRPKAVYGPGDNAVFPRILEAAKAGRLPRLGDGTTVTQLTYIDDIVDGLIAALDLDGVLGERIVGQTYVLAGPAVRVWDLIRYVLDRLDVPQPTRRLSTDAAMRIGRIVEGVWPALYRVSGGVEPPLTRYSAGILAYSQTYDTSKAERELGWTATTPLMEGVEAYIESLQDTASREPVAGRGSRVAGGGRSESEDRSEGGDSGELGVRRAAPRFASSQPGGASSVAVRVRAAGWTSAPRFAFLPGGGFQKIRIPALFAWIEHPEKGTIVFDTGYSPRFIEGTRGFPQRLMRWFTPPETSWDSSAAAILERNGVDPESVEWLLLSHFDPDHYGGLIDFPNARIVVTPQAWAAARPHLKDPGVAGFKERILPGHFPDNLAARICLTPAFNGPPVCQFDTSADLFGDGVLKLVSLPGHAHGQYGLFIQNALLERSGDSGGDDSSDREPEPLFLAADGCWTRASLDVDPPFGGAHLTIAIDRAAQKRTYKKLQAMRLNWQEVTIVPAHCPEAERELAAEAHSSGTAISAP